MSIQIILFIIYFSFFYLGSIWGSFINVFNTEIEPHVFKQKTKKGFWQRINRRSACPKCKTTLQTKNLFPIFSFLFQKGKCSFCSIKIAKKYLFIELFSGTIFLFLFHTVLKKYSFNLLSSSFWLEYLFLTFIFLGLTSIFIFDLKHKIIPNLVLYPTLILTSLYTIIYLQNWEIFLQAALFALPFFLLWFFSKGKAIGFADWKLIFLLSLFLPNMLMNTLFVFGSFWIGSIYTIPLIFLSKRYGLKSAVPFGPFILTSFFLVFFFQDVIFNLYQNVL